jgi:hypothetical protein
MLGTDGGFKILNVQRGSVPCVQWLHLSVPQDEGTCDAAGVPWDRTGGGPQAHYRTYTCFTQLVAQTDSDWWKLSAYLGAEHWLHSTACSQLKFHST